MSWPMVKLVDVVTLNPRAPKELDSAQIVSFVGMASVSEDGQLLSEEPRVLEETKKGFTYFAKSDVLLAKITPCFENGKCLRANQISNPVGFGSTEFHVLRPDESKLDATYLFYMIWSNQFRTLGAASMFGAAGQKRVGSDFLKNFEIPLPPLAEQKRIAAILDKADAIRRKRQQAIQLADDFLRAVFLEMFGDPVTNPKSWDRQSLDKVAPVLPFKKKVAEHENVWLLNLDAIEAQSGKIIHKLIVPYTEVGSSTNHFNELHVLYSKLRPYLNKVVIPNSEGMATSELLTLLPSQNKMTREFLAAYLRSKAFVSWANTKVAGAKMPRLSTVELKKHQIYVPPLQLQQEFSQRFRHVLDMVERSKEVLKINASFFNCLSQKAFSGQL